jgi:FG-GAP-like repeat/Astacin (Peptidase family M12A)
MQYPCTIKQLPEGAREVAARRAMRINPANGPSEQLVTAGVIEPDQLTALVAKYWGAGGVNLTVGFLDGPAADLRARILSHMNAWGQWANVRFVETGVDPQVRISRVANDGYWSYLGSDVLSIAPGQATMNLAGFTMATPDSEFVRVIRHETGHTLGFPHEHLRKEIIDGIDREKAIAYFMATQGWTREKVISNVLTPLDQSALLATAQADPNSIMCYALPGSIMKSGVAVPGGTDIDSQDAQFAALLYPKPTVKLAVQNYGYDAGGWRVERHPRLVADLTGDGRGDIVGFGNAGAYRSLNNGDGTFQGPVLAVANFGYDAGGWRVERHPRLVADLTGDGAGDIVGFGNAGVYASLNNGDGTFQGPTLAVANFGFDAGGWRVNLHPRTVADVTGDGCGDIVGFGNGGVWVALNNGDGSFGDPQLVVKNFGFAGTAGGWRVDRHPRFVADLTGDGAGDIVGFGNAGVWVALNNGDGTFQGPTLAVPNFGYDAGGWRVERHPRFVADVTGDGCGDIVGFGNGGVWVALNNGDGSFQAPALVVANFGYDAGGWRVERHPRFVADVTGDVAGDIVGFGNGGVWVALNKGDGTF